MSESWKTGYRKALTRYLVTNGGVPRSTGTYYGWQDYQASTELGKHASTCKPWTLIGEIQEDRVDMFQGTFADDQTEYQVVAHVSCKCGQYVNQEIRLGGYSMSEVIQGVLDS